MVQNINYKCTHWKANYFSYDGINTCLFPDNDLYFIGSRVDGLPEPVAF